MKRHCAPLDTSSVAGNPVAIVTAPTVHPIARASLHDEVTNRVRDMIVEGHLAAGSGIAELELAGQLGVSRTPLREALKVLAAEGLVELLPGRGAVVKAVTAKDAQDMLALIALLEEQAGRAACHASDEDIAAIVALHERMREHFQRRERLEYFRLNQDIHNAIVRAAGNPTLAMLHGILRTRMRRLRYVGNEAPGDWTAAMSEHETFINALKARDAEALSRSLREHLENTWPRVAATFATDDAGG
jgi:DNA-binding GntR family transcriptional regulator